MRLISFKFGFGMHVILYVNKKGYILIILIAERSIKTLKKELDLSNNPIIVYMLKSYETPQKLITTVCFIRKDSSGGRLEIPSG